MRALLLSNVAAVQFAYYTLSPAVAAGATYVPAHKTIVMIAFIAVNQDCSLMYGVGSILDGADLGANSGGMHGAIMCDGINIGFKNLNIAAQNLRLLGVTMS